MNPFLRASRLCVLFPVAAGMLCVCEVSWAQSQEKTAETPKTETKSGPKKPTRDTGWVTTTDPVALLTVRGAARNGEAPADDTANAAGGAPGEATTKGGEIAELEKQIQVKQKRIALLIRLFATDERPFLIDPGDTTVEATAQERRKYEQDEMLYETAELAKMRGRLEKLKAEKGEKVAEGKP